MSEGVLEKTINLLGSVKGLSPAAQEMHGELIYLKEDLMFLQVDLVQTRLISDVKSHFQNIEKGLPVLKVQLRQLDEKAGEVAKSAAKHAEDVHQSRMVPTRVERQTLFDFFGANEPGFIDKVVLPESDIAKIQVLAQWAILERKGLVNRISENVFELTERGFEQIKYLKSWPIRMMHKHMKKISTAVTSICGAIIIEILYQGTILQFFNRIVQGCLSPA